MFYRSLFIGTCAILSGAANAPAQAADYVIGVSGALTGPVAGSYAPAIDGMRIYFDRLNAKGGVNGKKIKLIIQDDQGQASNGAANAKKLISQNGVMLLINSSLSSTFAPMMAETRRAGIPLLFAGSVCPKETFPPAKANLFCTTAFAAKYDSQMSLSFIKEKASGNVNLGFSTMAIPVSRSEINYAEKLAPTLGMKAVGKEVVPPPTPDYSPFASNLKNAKANWVYSWAPWVTQVKTFEALRKLGWAGDYIAWAHLEAEDEAKRLKDEKLYLVGANSFFNENLPIHKEIIDAVKAAGSSYPANKMAEGWIAAMAIETALKAAGPKADAKKLIETMSSLTIDTKGLRGGPIVWTKDNHFRTKQYYRVYKWSGNDIKVDKDWKTYEIK